MKCAPGRSSAPLTHRPGPIEAPRAVVALSRARTPDGQPAMRVDQERELVAA